MKPVKLPMLLLLAALLLSGCALIPQPEPFITGTPWPTFTPRPSATPLPTATFTPTPYVAGLAGTPAAQSSAVISENNIKKLAVLNRIGQGVPQQIIWSADGAWMAVASTRGLSLYDGASLTLSKTTDIHGGARSLAFFSEGNFLLSGNNDGSLSIWGTATGRRAGDTRGHDASIFSVAVSPDNKWVASASWDKTIRLWRFTDEISQPLALVKTFSGFNSGIHKVMFSPDSSRLFAWSPERQIQVWQLPEGKPVEELYIGTTGGGRTATALAFSPDGGLVAALQNQQVRIFHTDNGTTLSTLKPFKGKVIFAALSKNGELAATLDQDRLLKLWQAENGKLITQISLPDEVDDSALFAFSPDGARLVLVSSRLWTWELPKRLLEEEEASLPEPSSIPAGFLPALPFFSQFTPDGAAMHSGLLNGRLYEAPLNQPFASIINSQLTSRPSQMALSDDLTWIAAGSSDLRLLVWPAGAAADEPQLSSAKHQQLVSAITFSHDSKLVVAAGGYGKTNVWNVENGEVLQTLNVPLGVSHLQFSPDDSLLTVVCSAGVQLWQTADWSLLDSFPGTAAAFAPDGALIAVSEWKDGEETLTLRQVSTESTTLLQQIPLNGNALAFSPDGSLLAVSGRSLSILRVSDGKLLSEFDPPLPFGEVFISPDGTYLALSHWDGTVSLWGIP